ncbi:hypothetical protein DsansV1_C05g0050861 [Dioscorea sansibarensis]
MHVSVTCWHCVLPKYSNFSTVWSISRKLAHAYLCLACKTFISWQGNEKRNFEHEKFHTPEPLRLLGTDIMENCDEDVLVTGNAELGIRIEFIHFPCSFKQSSEQWMLQECYPDDIPFVLFSDIDNHVALWHIFGYDLFFIHASDQLPVPIAIARPSCQHLSAHLPPFSQACEQCKSIECSCI